MPRITVSVFVESEAEKQKLIDKLTKIAKDVFCPLAGILPLPKGSTEIIPDFRLVSNPVGGPVIQILLHKKTGKDHRNTRKNQKRLCSNRTDKRPLSFCCKD